MTTRIVKRNDFDPGFWGPMTWRTLFIFALSYPWNAPGLVIRQNYLSFFTSLQGVIPCEKCRQGYRAFLLANPLEKRLISKLELLKWLMSLYNNKRPRDSRINNLNELSTQLVKPDKTVGAVINQMKKRYPNLKF